MYTPVFRCGSIPLLQLFIRCNLETAYQFQLDFKQYIPPDRLEEFISRIATIAEHAFDDGYNDGYAKGLEIGREEGWDQAATAY